MRQAREREALHVMQTPLGVIEWKMHFEVAAWNPAAERIFGYSKTEAMGRHAAGLVWPESAREPLNNSAQAWMGRVVPFFGDVQASL